MVAPLMIAGAVEIAKLAAPWLIGKVAGEKAGERTTEVLDIAAKIVGPGTPAEMLERLREDAQAQAEMQKALVDADVKWAEIDAKDRDSARTQQIELAKSKHIAGYAPVVISTLVVTGFFGMLYLVLDQEIPEGSQDVAYILLGSLGAGFIQVLNFWLGSSHGSKLKDAIVSTIRR